MSNHQITAVSGNAKTGQIPVSRSSRNTCPGTCPLRSGGGCYGEGGNCNIHWGRIDRAEYASVTNYVGFCSEVASLDPMTVSIWRHNELGDLKPETTNGDRIDRQAAEQLTQANSLGGNRGGFTYTHHDMIGDRTSKTAARHNRAVIRDMLRGGFVVNLSGDSLGHADALADLNLAPVVVVLPSDIQTKTKTPKGRPVVVCPATTAAGSARGITCESCKLCQRSNRRSIVGFPAHGMRKRALSNRLSD